MGRKKKLTGKVEEPLYEVELKKLEELSIPGALGVGEHDLDFIAGSDVEVDGLDDLPNKDRIYMEVDQSYGDYKTACTMMSTYGAILSLFNMKEKASEKKAIIKKAQERGWKPGQGRYTRNGVDTVIDVWNELHPDKKVLYIKSYIGDENFWKLISKGYGGIFTYRTSNEYTNDYRNDLCVDGDNFSNFKRGHAIAGYKGEKCGEILHVNTYPKRGKKNRYEVKYIEKLAENGVYWKGVYFPIPEKDFSKEEILKRKIIQAIMYLNNKLLKMKITNQTRAIIQHYNNYFYSVGFKPGN